MESDSGNQVRSISRLVYCRIGECLHTLCPWSKQIYYIYSDLVFRNCMLLVIVGLLLKSVVSADSFPDGSLDSADSLHASSLWSLLSQSLLYILVCWRSQAFSPISL